MHYTPVGVWAQTSLHRAWLSGQLPLSCLNLVGDLWLEKGSEGWKETKFLPSLQEAVAESQRWTFAASSSAQTLRWWVVSTTFQAGSAFWRGEKRDLVAF